MNNSNMVMERVAAKQAAKELNMDIESLHYLMQKNRLPIGYAMKKEKATRYTYYIYRGLLDTYKKQLTSGVLETSQEQNTLKK